VGLRSLLGRLAPEAAKLPWRVARAERAHLRTRELWRTPGQELLEGTQLVADRLVMLDRLPKGGRVAEIGVAAGDFSAEILARCRPDRLVLIDPWELGDGSDFSAQALARVEARFAPEIAAGRVEIRRGRSGAVLPALPADSFDWVYVDAAHDFDSVAADLELCRRVVRPGGLIAGHDYLRWASPTERYGVVEAVNDFARRTGSPFVFLTNQADKHDSFALRLSK
jgi:predicted O-methyltransferase YrrM